MKEIYNIIWTEKTNKFLSLFKWINPTIFKDYISKEGLKETLQFTKFLIRLSLKILFFIIFALLFPLITDFPTNENFLFFFGSCVALTSVTPILKMNEEDYIFIKLFRMNKKEYIKKRVHMFLLENSIFFGIALFFSYKVLARPWFVLLCIIPITLSIRLIIENYSLRQKEKKKTPILENLQYKKIKAVLYFAIFLFCFQFGTNYVNISLFTISGLILILILLGISAYIEIQNVRDWDNLFFKYLTTEKITEQKLKIYFKKEKIEPTHVKEEGVFDYNFLYHALEKRLNRPLNSEDNFFKYLFLFVLCLLIGCLIYQNFFQNDWLKGMSASNIYYYFIGILMNVSYSKKYLKICFLEIDRYLKNHAFFETKEAQLENRKLRLQNVFKKDFINATIFVIIGLLFSKLTGDNLSKTLWIISVYSFSFLAMAFHFFIYYKMEPYHFDGTSNGPWLNMFDFLTTLICFGPAFLQITIPRKIIIGEIILGNILSFSCFWYLLRKEVHK